MSRRLLALLLASMAAATAGTLADQGVPPPPFRPAALGVISGTVVDATGAPVVNAEIQARRTGFVTYGFSAPVVGIVQSATTDARGVYRITGLEPGPYLVAAPSQVFDRTTPLMLTASRLPATIVQPDGSKLGYVTTFFPGVTSSERARTLQVQQGEVAHIDFAVQRATVVDVKGVVTGGSGLSTVALASENAFDQLGGTDVQRQAVSPDGTFAFANVLPGNYYVSGVGLDAAGRVPIVVSAAMSGTVTLAMQPNVTVYGRVVFRGDIAPTETDWSVLRVSLVSEPQPLGSPYLALLTPYRAVMEPNGTFTIANVPRGRYQLLASPTPWPWSQAVGTIGGIDTMLVSLEISTNVTDALVALAIKR